MAGRPPNLRVERELIAAGHLRVAGVDEVGRGALGGPVTVGVVVVDPEVRRPPAGLRDSKLLTPAARCSLVPRIRRWARASAVAHAMPDEIDQFGILAALRLAGHRALAMLETPADAVLLDGNYDYLTPRVPDLEQLALLDVPPRPAPELPDLGFPRPPVRVRIKADLTCSAVAAASVLAKVERDGLMVQLASEHPGYGWDENKGYASPAHLDALRELGPCPAHRRSWRLPGQRAGEDVDVDELDVLVDLEEAL